MNAKLVLLATYILFVFLTLLDVSYAAAPSTGGSATTLPSVFTARRIKIGDTKETVVSLLGQPKQHIEFENELTFYYERCTVVFDSGKVRTIKVFSDEEITKKKEEKRLEYQIAADREKFQRILDGIQAEAAAKRQREEQLKRQQELEQKQIAQKEALQRQKEAKQRLVDEQRRRDLEGRRQELVAAIDSLQLQLADELQADAHQEELNRRQIADRNRIHSQRQLLEVQAELYPSALATSPLSPSLSQIRSQFDPNSLANPYGAGSPYKADGLMNPYSQYGSRFSNKSWNNPYATDAPRLLNGKGEYMGKLSRNTYDPDSVSNPFGINGNQFSPNSINNPYGAGNPFSTVPIYVVPSR